MLHIKLTEKKHRTQCKQIVCPFAHSRILDGVKGQKHFLKKCCMFFVFFFKKMLFCITNLKGKKCRTLCSDTQDGLNCGRIGFIFRGKHPLLVTRIQVSDPGPKDPLVFQKYAIAHCNQVFEARTSSERSPLS